MCRRIGKGSFLISSKPAVLGLIGSSGHGLVVSHCGVDFLHVPNCHATSAARSMDDVPKGIIRLLVRVGEVILCILLGGGGGVLENVLELLPVGNLRVVFLPTRMRHSTRVALVACNLSRVFGAGNVVPRG